MLCAWYISKNVKMEHDYMYMTVKKKSWGFVAVLRDGVG